MRIIILITLLLSASGCGVMDGVAKGALYPFLSVNKNFAYQLPEGIFEIDEPDFFAWEVVAPGPKIVYLHGNGESLTALQKSGLIDQVKKVGHTFIVEYPGLKPVEGEPSEEALVKAGIAAFMYVKKLYSTQSVVIIGRSLGAGVAMQVAAKVSPDKLILVSPWTSFKDAAKASPLGFLSWAVSDGFWVKNSYNTLEAAKSYKGASMVIHGYEDGLIPYAQGLAVSDALKAFLVTVEGKGHNDLFVPAVFESMRQFTKE